MEVGKDEAIQNVFETLEEKGENEDQ